MNIDSRKPQLLKDLASLSARLPPMYEVGGAVRDRLLGRETCDIDVAAHDPEKAARLMERTLGTKTVAFNRESRTTACYRILSLNDPGIHLDLVHIQGKSIENDLARRDFTINAMARPLGAEKDLEIIDPFGGREDLKQGIIRATRQENIVQDPLRIMRAFRLSAQLDFGIEPRTREVIRENSGLVLKSAPERIKSELAGLLESGRGCRELRLMDELGVLAVLFPEIAPMRGCTQNAFHHLDVLRHSFQAYASCEEIVAEPEKTFPGHGEEINAVLAEGSRLPWLKLAALMHDMGKPCCRKRRGRSGRITFYGHEKTGAGMAEDTARRFRFSAREGQYLRLLISEHMHIFALSGAEVKKSTLMRFLRRVGDDLIPIVILGLADSRATQGEKRPQEEAERFEVWAREVIRDYFRDFKAEMQQKPLLTGRDLLNLGLPPGPRIGKILREARLAQDDGIINDRNQALAWARTYTGKPSG